MYVIPVSSSKGFFIKVVIRKKKNWGFEASYMATSCNLLWPSSEAWIRWASSMDHQLQL